MLNQLVDAVQIELPQLSRPEAEAAVAAVLGVLGHLAPYRETAIISQQGCWLRDGPNGPQIGTVLKNVGVCAGKDENGWTHILLLACVGSGMLQA